MSSGNPSQGGSSSGTRQDAAVDEEEMVNIEEHKQKYLNFLIDLEKTLLDLDKQKQDLEEDISEYKKLLEPPVPLVSPSNPEGTIMVDIGCGVYVQAIPETVESLIVNVGYGFHVELKRSVSTTQSDSSGMKKGNSKNGKVRMQVNSGDHSSLIVFLGK